MFLQSRNYDRRRRHSRLRNLRVDTGMDNRSNKPAREHQVQATDTLPSAS